MCSDVCAFYIRSKRSLYAGQPLHDLQGMLSIVSKAKSIDPNSRKRSSVRFKFCDSKTTRPGCVSHISGPLALLNGACEKHANCVTTSFDAVEVGDTTIEKGVELTICYDSDGAVDVNGASVSGIRCGFNKCGKVIIK